MKFRPLSTITDNEVKIFAEECFSGKFIQVLTRTDEVVSFDMETMWTGIDGKPEPMIDEVRLFCTEKDSIDTNFSIGWEDEEMWQQFMIHFGFHPLFKENPFEKYYVPKAWRFR